MCKAFLTMLTLTQFLLSVNFGVAGKATSLSKVLFDNAHTRSLHG